MSTMKPTPRDLMTEALLAADCQWNFVSIRQALDAVDASLCSRQALERALHEPMRLFLRRPDVTLNELVTCMEQAILEIQPFLRLNDKAAKTCARLLWENNTVGPHAVKRPARRSKTEANPGLVLFLDFDGVLHPEFPWRKEVMVHRGLFEQAIRPYPDVDIVISSAWRHSHSLDEMRALFSHDIAMRIVHTTPPLPAVAVDEFPGKLSEYTRQAECEAWLHTYRAPAAPWIALDDRPQLFEPGCSRLLVTRSDTGLTSEHVPRLQAMIESEMSQSTGGER